MHTLVCVSGDQTHFVNLGTTWRFTRCGLNVKGAVLQHFRGRDLGAEHPGTEPFVLSPSLSVTLTRTPLPDEDGKAHRAKYFQ